MKKSGWGFLGIAFLLLIVRDIYFYIQQNLTTISIIGGAILIIFFTFSEIIKKAKEQKNTQERLLSNQITQTSRSDYIRGYKILREAGWVNVRGCETTQLVEQKIRAEATQKGANAVIKLHWKMRKESYVAGRGKKGNPYYRNRTVYDGEGLGVIVEKSTPQKRQVNTTILNKVTSSNAGYPSGWVALDGNNIFGKIHEQTNDVEHTFNILRTVIRKLSHSPYKPHVFWDGKFVTFAHATDPSSRGINFENWLQEKLGIPSGNLTVSEFIDRADILIVPWAYTKKAAIISNDNFNKNYEDDLIASKAQELKNLGLLLKFSFIAGELVIPEMTSL